MTKVIVNLSELSGDEALLNEWFDGYSVLENFPLKDCVPFTGLNNSHMLVMDFTDDQQAAFRKIAEDMGIEHAMDADHHINAIVNLVILKELSIHH